MHVNVLLGLLNYSKEEIVNSTSKRRGQKNEFKETWPKNLIFLKMYKDNFLNEFKSDK